MVVDPKFYHEIERDLQVGRIERESYIKRFIDPLRDRLKSDGFEFEMSGRVKNVYSIYRKMKRQDKPLNEIYDVFAIRIDRKSTRLNSSHVANSYAVFCLKKKK